MYILKISCQVGDRALQMINIHYLLENKSNQTKCNDGKQNFPFSCLFFSKTLIYLKVRVI